MEERLGKAGNALADLNMQESIQLRHQHDEIDRQQRLAQVSCPFFFSPLLLVLTRVHFVR